MAPVPVRSASPPLARFSSPRGAPVGRPARSFESDRPDSALLRATRARDGIDTSRPPGPLPLRRDPDLPRTGPRADRLPALLGADPGPPAAVAADPGRRGR